MEPSKESMEHSEDYSFMIFGNNPLLDDSGDATRVSELPNFHNELPISVSSNELHKSTLMQDPFSPSHGNDEIKDACNIQNTSCQNLSSILPLPHKSSTSFSIPEFSEPSQDNIKGMESQIGFPAHHLNHKPPKSLAMLSSMEDCNSVHDSTTNPLDFNLENSNPRISDENNYNSAESKQVICAEDFKKPISSSYQQCQDQTLSFPEINLSNDKTMFTKCSKFDSCGDPDCSRETSFQSLLSEGSNHNFVQTSQYINQPSNTFEKNLYLFHKNKELNVTSNVESRAITQISSQELNRVQDHFLTSNPLVSQENKKLDDEKKSPSMFNFHSSSSLNTSTISSSFKNSLNSQDVRLFEENPLLREKNNVCLNKIIQVHNRGENEDAIQDSSDIYDHIMGNINPTGKTNVFSNEDNSRDGLANLNIEHLNDNSLSNIEINEKLSEDLLSKETNLNLYTTNLTEFLDSNNQFNETTLANERNAMNICDSLKVNDLNFNNRANGMSVSDRDEKTRNGFECDKSIIPFEKKLPEVESILQKLPIDITNESSSIPEISSFNLSEDNAINTDTADLDTNDLSNIVLNNGIFNLDTKDQSIQKIKETYNIEEDNSVLMIENPVDSFREQIFKAQLKQDIQHVAESTTQQLQQPIEPRKEKLNHINFNPSNSTKTRHSNEILSCENQILDSELHVLDNIGEHFNTKQVDMEINDFYHNESDYICNINSKEQRINNTQLVSDLHVDKVQAKNTNTVVKENFSDSKLFPELKPFPLIEQSNVTTPKQNTINSKSQKIKKENDNNKKKGKTKVCINQDSSNIPPYVSLENMRFKHISSDKTIPSAIDIRHDLRDQNKHCKPENTRNILKQTKHDFDISQNGLIEQNQKSERLESPLKLEFLARNTLSEIVAPPIVLKDSVKRRITDQSKVQLVDLPSKKIKYEDMNMETSNVFTENLPALCSVDDIIEKAPKIVKRKSNKEQALNKLKLILITNKDVNLNNELISLNEEEVLQKSPTVSESDEKSINLDDPSKSLIDSSKLMDEDNETMMGTQMLENIEMFGNFSEYFNIDQNSELNEELNDSEIEDTSSMSIKLNEIEDLRKISAFVKSEDKSIQEDQSNVTKDIEIKKKRRNSKEKVSIIEDNLKRNNVILNDEKVNVQEISKVSVKKKKTTPKLLKNIIVNKKEENVTPNKTNKKIVKKPKIIKQIFCKSSIRKPSNTTINLPADDKVSKDILNESAKSTLEICNKKSTAADSLNESLVHETENFDEIDTKTNIFDETPSNIQKEIKNLVNSTLKSVTSRSRSNSSDSHSSETKKKSTVKILTPLKLDNSIGSHNKSLEIVNQPIVTTLNTNQEFSSQNENLTVSKSKKKVKPKIETQKTNQGGNVKISKSNRSKTTTTKSPKKDLKTPHSQLSEVSTNAKIESTAVKESFTDQLPIVDTKHVTEKTHKDIECQTDEQIERQIIILNDMSSLDIDPMHNFSVNTNSKYLYKTITEKYTFLSDPTHSITFPDTVSSSFCKILPNSQLKKINEVENNQLQISTPSSPYGPLIDSLKCIKSLELKTTEDKFEERIDQSNNALNKLYLESTIKEPDIDHQKAITDREEAQNVSQVLEAKTKIINNRNLSEQKSFIADTLKKIKSLNDVTGNKLDFTKKPKYIMVKLKGNEKVYKLIQKPVTNEITALDPLNLPKSAYSSVDSKFKVENLNKQILDNINLTIQANHCVKYKKHNESIEFQHTKSGCVPLVTSKQKCKSEKNLKSNTTQDESILQTFDKSKFINVGKKQINHLLNKTNLLRNEINKVSSHKEDHNLSTDDVDIVKKRETVSKDLETVVSTIEINKGVPLRLISLSKNPNTPKEKKIIRMVPLYANKGKQMGSIQNSLQDQMKVINNNSGLPLNQVTSILDNVSEQNRANLKSKLIQVQNNNGVKTLVINNKKSEQDSPKSLLETNKLILDILNKNKIKTIILGCNNKEIMRKDLSNVEPSRIENEIRNLNKNFIKVNKNDEKSSRNLNTICLLRPDSSMCKADHIKQKFNIITNEKRTELQPKVMNHTQSILSGVQVNCPDSQLTELVEMDINIKGNINSFQQKYKNYDSEQTKELEKERGVLKDIDLIKDLKLDTKKDVINENQAVDNGKEENGKHRLTTNENGKTTNRKRETSELTQAIEDLDTLCDIIKIYKCKLCTFTSNKKNGFVHHLKSAHNRTLVVNTDDFAVETSDATKYDHKDVTKIPDATQKGTTGQSETSQSKNEKTEDEEVYNSWLADPICHFKPFKCKIPTCGVKLASENSLNIHSACHLSKGFKCYEVSCKEVFALWHACTNHMHKEHSIDCDLIYCPVPSCSYVTNTRAGLGRHLRTHSREKRYPCEICGKKLRQKTQLANHRVIHEKKTGKIQPEGDKWYQSKQCHLCSRTYADIKCLKKHIREVHHRLKPFQCAVCGFRTGRKATLTLHVRQHTREKPYACTSCAFRTGDHNTLRKHMQTHMAKRKYQCTFATCSYSSRELYKLKEHVVAKHQPRYLDIMPEHHIVEPLPPEPNNEDQSQLLNVIGDDGQILNVIGDDGQILNVIGDDGQILNVIEDGGHILNEDGGQQFYIQFLSPPPSIPVTAVS